MRQDTNKLHLPYTVARLSEALEALDEIHSAACEQSLDTVNRAGTAEILGYLHEIVFLAQEAAREIEAGTEQRLIPFPVERAVNADDGSDSPDGRPDKLTPFRVMPVAKPYLSEKWARG